MEDLKKARELLKKRQKEKREETQETEVQIPVAAKKPQEKKKRVLPGHFTDDNGVGKLEFSARKPGSAKQGAIPKVEKTDDLKLARELLKKRSKAQKEEERAASPNKSSSPIPKRTSSPFQDRPASPSILRQASPIQQNKEMKTAPPPDAVKKTQEKKKRVLPGHFTEEKEVGKLQFASKKKGDKKLASPPKAEKTDDLKTAREMLKKRQQEKPASPNRSRSPIPNKSSSPIPNRNSSPIPNRNSSPIPNRSVSPIPARAQSPKRVESPNRVESPSRAGSPKLPEDKMYKMNFVPKKEKVDDIKLARELLKRRQRAREEQELEAKKEEEKLKIEEEIIQEAPVVEEVKVKPPRKFLHMDKLSGLPKEKEEKAERKVGKLSGEEWNKDKTKLGSAPKAQKVDDLSLARQILRRRRKSQDRLEQHMATKKVSWSPLIFLGGVTPPP